MSRPVRRSAARRDDVPLSSAAAEGLKEEPFNAAGTRFEAWTDANLHAIAVLRNGRLIYEKYFTGLDERLGSPLGCVAYDACRAHDLRSITKSIISIVYGIAVDKRLVPEVDTPVFAVFPECADLRSAGKDRITFRHLLSMSAGLAWDETMPYSDPANSERRLSDASDRCRYVLQQRLVQTPGETYAYNGGLTILLAEVLARASGCPIDALANKLLFAPLGITGAEWVRHSDGVPNAASGLRLRARDLAKVGRLVLDGGRWNGLRIVSEGWIREATSPQINGEGLFFYGFQWWLGRSLVTRTEVNWIAAVGFGGQRMYLVPRFNMVIVVLAGLYDNPSLSQVVGDEILRLVLRATQTDAA
jgi:CubicO group peptidase (beta-lactamase class C family)